MSLRILGLVLVVSALAATTPAAAAAATATTWDEALALSSEQGKPILIDFFTEW